MNPAHSNFRPTSGASPARSVAAFTLIELLTVIAIMGILAGLLVGLAPLATAKIRENRTRAELEKIVLAIEAYKAKYGTYPPDNFDGVTINTVLNPLYYELSGMLVFRDAEAGGRSDFPQVARFEAPDGEDYITSAQSLTYFSREGFVNAVWKSERRKLLTYEFKASDRAAVFRSPADGPTNIVVLAVPFPWPTDQQSIYPSPVPRNPTLNPWRYNSSNPTNNPNGYDLWAEIFVRGQKRIIGNWKS